MKAGMIVAPQPEAVDAGADILRRGGNAIDAAIACAFVETVVDPMMCGIAGFGSFQAYMPGAGIHEAIDFHGRVPAAARPDMWLDLIEGETRDGFGFLLEGHVNDIGHQSVTTPGSLKAYHEAHSRFGTLPWGDVVAPAIAHARDGFAVTPGIYHYWISEDPSGRISIADRLRHTAEARRLFCDEGGGIRRMGTILRNPDYAASLERIAAAGPDVFYRGAIGRAIADDMAANGGLLSIADLEAYETVPGQPLRGSYRGFDIATNRPPGGGVMLLEMLHILENFDLAAMGHNSPDYIRTVAEAMKIATSDKDAHVGDPAFVDVPLDRLLSKDYARERAGGIERGEVWHVERMGGPEPEHTTHLSVIDREGNAVSMTHSLGMMSGVIPPGLGFMLNGCMGVFDPRPGRAGSIAPGKARFSSICPSILFKDGRPWLVIGAPGGTQIAMGVLQAILNAVDFGMPVTEAVIAPRFSATSDAIDVSNRISRHTGRALEAMGYAVIRSHLSYAFASVQAILIEDGVPSGASDITYGGGMALAV